MSERKHLITTSKKHRQFIAKTSRLVVFREIITVYCKDHKKYNKGDVVLILQMLLCFKVKSNEAVF